MRVALRVALPCAALLRCALRFFGCRMDRLTLRLLEPGLEEQFWDSQDYRLYDAVSVLVGFASFATRVFNIFSTYDWAPVDHHPYFGAACLGLILVQLLQLALMMRGAGSYQRHRLRLQCFFKAYIVVFIMNPAISSGLTPDRAEVALAMADVEGATGTMVKMLLVLTGA